MKEFQLVVVIFLLIDPFVLPAYGETPLWPTGHSPNLPPIAECGDDLTALVGEIISFDGSQSYDPDNTTGWFALTPLSIPRRLPASGVFDSRIYVFGGAQLDPSGRHYVPTDVTEVYDPSTGNWSELAPMPTARELVTAAALKARLYVIGGAKLKDGDPALPRVSSDAVEVYDPVNDVWEIRNPLPRQPFQGWAPATSVDDTIIAVENTGLTYVYDEATDKWTQRASVPVSIGNHAITSYDGKVYLFGGILQTGVTNQTWIYDPGADKWTAGPPMPTPRRWLTASVWKDEIYVVGGQRKPPWQLLDVVEVLNPGNGTWRTEDSMPTRRDALTSSATNDALFAVGGQGYPNSQPLATNEAIMVGLKYLWDFGDGSPSAEGESVGHSYSSSGTYTVTLTVTDPKGAEGKDSCTITVTSANQIPKADAGGPYYGNEGSPVTLDGSISFDPDNDTLQYRWDLDNNGVWDTGWSSDPTAVNTWMDNGRYSVVLIVKDAHNETDLDNGTVYVSDLAPVAEFGWSPEPQNEGSPVQFKDLSSSYPDAISSWSWEFGDGGTNTSQDPSHAFGDNGIYPVILTVTDEDGSIAVISHNVTILNVAPTAEAGEDKEGYEVSAFTFDGSCTDPGTLDTHTYEWDFDYDGITFDVDATGQSVTHTWIDDFDGYVALRVTDDDGGEGIDTAHVLVKNVPPTVELKVVPIEVDVSLRMAGEKWHDVSIELYEDGVLVAEGSLTRYPGSPNDQMLDLAHIDVDISKQYSAIVRYTPEDDPVNGQPNGASPCWIILRFNDGEEVWLHHTFNVQHPETYVWEVDLTAAILSHGITFEAIAFDPGADDLTFRWDFLDGTDITNFYPNLDNTHPVEITDTVTHAFPGSGTYVVSLTVVDDDSGSCMATVTIEVP